MTQTNLPLPTWVSMITMESRLSNLHTLFQFLRQSISIPSLKPMNRITPHLTKPLLSTKLSHSPPRLFPPCTKNKGLLRTLKSMPTPPTNKASHIAPFLESSYTPSLRVALILAIMSPLSASSPPHLLPSITPCSRMSHDTLVGPARGVSSIVNLLRIPRCLALPHSLYQAHWICLISRFRTNPANSSVLWMLLMPKTFAVAVQRLAMHSS